MAAANQRQPPPGYPTGGNAEERAPPVDNNNKDEDETDRGISARFMIGRNKPRSHERYPGPGLVPFDDYVPPPPPRGPHRAPGYDYPPPHGYGVHRHQTPVEFEVSDDEEEDDYENGYGHQPIPYGKKPQQFYRRETYVVEPPPPAPRRRPLPYAPEGNYYVRDEYVRY